MKKTRFFIMLQLLFIIAFSFDTLARGTVDLKKYISDKDYVKNLSYNFISKSGRSFTHILTLYKDIKYNILVISTNPDITIYVMDSAKVRTLKTIKESTLRDDYNFFYADFVPTKSSIHNIQVKANKSEDFEYYFLVTYEVYDVKNIPESQNQIINAFDDFSKKIFSNNQLKINNKVYSKKLIGFLYFPTGQYNYRYLYKDNTFYAQSFTMDKNEKLAFYEGRGANRNKTIHISVNTEKLDSQLGKFSSKSFAATIKKESLYTIDLDCTGPSILLSFQLFEEKPSLVSDIFLTKPVPEVTYNMTVNLAGYVTNWKDLPANYVIVKRINGNDVTTFRLDPNLIGNIFNFDLNIPLTPGKNKLVIEAYVNGEKKTIEKNVNALAVPKSLLIELTWDKPATDLDLYVQKPDGEIVCFENQNEGFPKKGWLDIDDKDGYGPERFRIDSPESGEYKIYAHYYNGNVSTNASVKIIMNENIKEYKGTLKESNKLNSSPVNMGKGSDWLYLGSVTIK